MSGDDYPKSLILVAEPDSEARQTLAHILRSEGHTPLEVDDGYKALEVLRQGRVDIAILAENLPSLDEWEVLQQCHRLGLRLPIMLATNSWSVTRGVKAIKAGARDYINKPYLRSEVVEVLRNAFDPDQAPVDTHGEALRDAQKLEAVGRLAGGVVHDFNNLLTVILGYGDLLRGCLSPGASVREYVSEIIKAAEDGAALTAQLLAFSRTRVVEPTILNLNDSIRHGESLVRRFLGDRVELKTEPGSNLGHIRADASQIDQVLMNLAINARDAMPTGGTFTIRTGMHEVSSIPPTPLYQDDTTGNASSWKVEQRISPNEGARGSFNHLLSSDIPPNPLEEEGCGLGNTPPSEAGTTVSTSEGGRGILNSEAVVSGQWPVVSGYSSPVSDVAAAPSPSPPVLRGRGAGGEGVESLLPPGSYIVLTVEDTGCGMDTQTLSRLFEPFFTTKRHGHGTGLGLATVHNIVRQWGGYISVRSELGRGTCFTIYFPQVAACGFAFAAGATVHLQGDETVLLLEEEAPVRNIVRLTLETNGYTVLEAGSPQDALYLASDYRGPIHLFITDLVHSEVPAADIAKRAARARPGMKALFIAGHSNHDLVEEVLKEANATLLQKPFTTDALLAKVREALLQREVRNVG